MEVLTYQKERSITENNQVNGKTELNEKREEVLPTSPTPSTKVLSNKIGEIEKTTIASQFNNSSPKKRVATSKRSSFVDEIPTKNQVNKVAHLGKKELGNKTKDLQRQDLAINIPNKIVADKNMEDFPISNLPTLFNLLETKDKVIPPTIHSIVPTIKNNPSFYLACLLYTSPSPRDATLSRMPSSA